MGKPRELTILLEDEDVERLMQLAGSETAIADYLSRVIRTLHMDLMLSGDGASLDRLTIAEQKASYQAQVRVYQQYMKKMTLKSAELLAEVNHLNDSLLALKKINRNGPLF